jgi:fructose-1,6-bisphosphatase/inositol monophosphatase family enzyme
MSLDSRYTFLRRLAPAAGALALAFWRQRSTLVVELKGPQDFVSRADREVEAFIHRDCVAFRTTPGEETADRSPNRRRIYWIVDPIGTPLPARLACGNVSIAYVENGVRTLGAVYRAGDSFTRGGGGPGASAANTDSRPHPPRRCAGRASRSTTTTGIRIRALSRFAMD